jgi:hypothetical protein
MAGTFLVGKTVTAKLAYLNPDGTAGAPVGVPTWAFDNAAVWAPTVAADGMSAAGNVLAVGACVVTVTAEGDATPGVDTVTLTGTLTGAVEISGGSLTFTVA